MKIKKRYIRIMSIVLACCIFFVQPSFAQAAENVNSQITTNDFLNYGEINENSDSQQVYDDLSEEAKVIFLNYLINYDESLYEYHKKNVVETDSYQIESQSTHYSIEQSQSLLQTQLAATNPLAVLSDNLYQIKGLSESVIYALEAAGAAFLADLASLGATKIVTILLAGGCLIVLVSHWGEVSSAWSEIVNAFKKAFGSSVSDSTMTLGFSQAKLRYEQDYSKNQTANQYAFSSSYTTSCWRHIDMQSALTIMSRRGSNYKIYSSHYGDSAMVVIDIPAGLTANISRSLATTQLGNYNVGGGKLYILYNLSTHTYFHMHVKVIGDDTDILRHANGLCYQTWPVYSYDPQYDHSSTSFYVPTDAWNNPL